MSRVHTGLQTKQFTMPASVERKSVCAITGKLPTNGCPVITEYFAKDTLPTQYCPGHKSEKDKDEEEEDEDSSNNSSNTTNSTNTDNTSDEGNTPEPEPEPEPEPSP